jgi:hypothetical protein
MRAAFNVLELGARRRGEPPRRPCVQSGPAPASLLFVYVRRPQKQKQRPTSAGGQLADKARSWRALARPRGSINNNGNTDSRSVHNCFVVAVAVVVFALAPTAVGGPPVPAGERPPGSPSSCRAGYQQDGGGGL